MSGLNEMYFIKLRLISMISEMDFDNVNENSMIIDKELSELLRYFRSFLKDEGFAIVSIPNVANWMVRIKLLSGKFDYDGGILDPGHLRFFTYRTAKRLLEDNGYKVIAVVNNNQTWLFRFLGRYFKRIFAFQFVFKCIKA